MFKGVIIRKCGYLVILSMSLTSLSSCGGSNEKNKAEALLLEANSRYENDDLDSSFILLDSLKKNYSTEIEIQRSAMHLRTLIDEKTTLEAIQANDSILLKSMATKDKLDHLFEYVKTKDMVEGYYILKEANKDPLINRTGVEVRIDDQGAIYLISMLAGKSIKHTKLEVEANNGDRVSTKEIPYDNASNYRFKNDGISYEMVTFKSNACDSLCQFIVSNSSKPLKLSFVGSSKNTISLNDKLKKLIVDTYNYSQALQSLKKAEGLKLYLDNKLRIARDQIERTKPKN